VRAAVARQRPILSNTCVTCTGRHSAPLVIGIPRSFNAAAMARSDVTPAACSSETTDAMSAASPQAHCGSLLRRHLRLDPLHGAGRYPEFNGYLADAQVALLQSLADIRFHAGINSWQAVALGLGARKTGADPFLDYGTFELGEMPITLAAGTSNQPAEGDAQVEK
jgi:hypothetical protein